MGTLKSRMALLQAGAEALVLDGDEPVCRLKAVFFRRETASEPVARRRRDTFSPRATNYAIAVIPWLARTEKELRFSGYRLGHQHRGDLTALTAQEAKIARMAASGMPSEQIAERLYLSHRTLVAHLYRIFPKLAVTSRVGLRDALSPLAGNTTAR